MTAPEAYNVTDLEHRKGPEFKQVYCNHAVMAMSVFDASIIFGELVPGLGPKTAPTITDHVNVTMSWEHLKALYDGIGKIIENFEETQGVKIRPVSKSPMTFPKQPSES